MGRRRGAQPQVGLPVFEGGAARDDRAAARLDRDDLLGQRPGLLRQRAVQRRQGRPRHLDRSVATRYGRHGIRCNAVAPGTVRTDAWARAWPRSPICSTASPAGTRGAASARPRRWPRPSRSWPRTTRRSSPARCSRRRRPAGGNERMSRQLVANFDDDEASRRPARDDAAAPRRPRGSGRSQSLGGPRRCGAPTMTRRAESMLDLLICGARVDPLVPGNPWVHGGRRHRRRPHRLGRTARRGACCAGRSGGWRTACSSAQGSSTCTRTPTSSSSRAVGTPG